jgi:hypothetical protein
LVQGGVAAIFSVALVSFLLSQWTISHQHFFLFSDTMDLLFDKLAVLKQWQSEQHQQMVQEQHAQRDQLALEQRQIVENVQFGEPDESRPPSELSESYHSEEEEVAGADMSLFQEDLPIRVESFASPEQNVRI